MSINFIFPLNGINAVHFIFVLDVTHSCTVLYVVHNLEFHLRSDYQCRSVTPHYECLS